MPVIVKFVEVSTSEPTLKPAEVIPLLAFGTIVGWEGQHVTVSYDELTSFQKEVGYLLDVYRIRIGLDVFVRQANAKEGDPILAAYAMRVPAPAPSPDPSAAKDQKAG